MRFKSLTWGFCYPLGKTISIRLLSSRWICLGSGSLDRHYQEQTLFLGRRQAGHRPSFPGVNKPDMELLLQQLNLTGFGQVGCQIRQTGPFWLTPCSWRCEEVLGCIKDATCCMWHCWKTNKKPTNALSAGQEGEGWVLFKDVLIKSIPFYTSRFCSKIQLNHEATKDPNYQRER